jgi:mono/diheme cytochrome c family protein
VRFQTVPRSRVLRALLFAALVAGALAAQSASRSSADGVYTRQQADQGRDLFALACQSCHAPTQHSLPPFRQKWFGRTLGDLFGYLRREMPQTDPGTMSDEEYAQLVAYLMRINGMPTGRAPLAADSAALHTIRIDSVPTVPASRSFK